MFMFPSNLFVSNTCSQKQFTVMKLGCWQNNCVFHLCYFISKRTWKIKMGITRKVYPIAELVELRRCSALTSGARKIIPANIMLYKTPTRETHSRIHNGTKTTSQSHRMKSSRRRARKINWRMLTEQKSSSYGKT